MATTALSRKYSGPQVDAEQEEGVKAEGTEEEREEVDEGFGRWVLIDRQEGRQSDILVEDDHWGGNGVLVDGGGEGGHLVEGREGGHDHGGQGGLREGGWAPGMCRLWKEDPRQVPFKGES